MAGASDENTRELYDTPTWAMALVCAVMIVISLLLEKGLHHIGKWFRKKNKGALGEALEKVKSELMILGFISLLLVFFQNYIAEICIPESAGNIMLPCSRASKNDKNQRRRLLWAEIMDFGSHRRSLADETTFACPKGKVPLMSAKSLHELHLFIFFLAVVHVVSSASAMTFGIIKISSWTKWENETLSLDYESSTGLFMRRPLCSSTMQVLGTDTSLFFTLIFRKRLLCYAARFQHNKKRRLMNEWSESSLFYFLCKSRSKLDSAGTMSCSRRSHSGFFCPYVGRGLGSCTFISWYFLLVSFIMQFKRSVKRTDYFTLRHGFINAHLNPGMKFNFQKYIRRSLDDDFKVVVGISPTLWACGIIIVLLNVHSIEKLFGVTLLPLVLILAIGTKLQAIIATMTLEIQERHSVIQEMPIVKLSDQHFWFGRPRLLLFLIHFTMFVNAFQLTYFLWIWYKFGLNSCFHENFGFVIARICIGITVHILCSYRTLPLYALVSQMGSHIKMSIFAERTSKALKKWCDEAKKRHKKGSSRSRSVSPSPSPGQSPMASPTSRHLYHYATMRNANTGFKKSNSDNEFSDSQIEMPVTRSELRNHNLRHDVWLNMEHGGDESDVQSVSPSPSPGQSPMTSPTSRHLYHYETIRNAGTSFRFSNSNGELSDGQIEMPVTRSELSHHNLQHDVRLNMEHGRYESDENDVRLCYLS